MGPRDGIDFSVTSLIPSGVLYPILAILGADPAAAAEPADPPAQHDSALPGVEELLALPDHAERIARVEALQDPPPDYATTVRLGALLAVLNALQAAERTDPAVVRGFLEAALSDDGSHRDAAVERAEAGGLPPSQAPAPAPVVARPAPAPVAGPSLTKLRFYKDKRLYKGTLQLTSGFMSSNAYGSTAAVSTQASWTVYQGASPLRPKDFATLVGDTQTLARMKQTDQTLAGVTVGLLLGGAVVTGLGFAMIGDGDDATDSAGIVLGALVGPCALGAGIGIPLGLSMRRRWVAAAYQPDEADDWIHRHNDELRAQLGLTERDVLQLETLGP